MKTAVRKRKAVVQEEAAPTASYTLKELLADKALSKSLQGKIFRNVKMGTTQVAGYGMIHHKFEFIQFNAVAPPPTYVRGPLVLVSYNTMTTGNLVQLYLPEELVFEVVEDPRDASYGDVLELSKQLSNHLRKDNVGSDPELFAVDADGALIPAFEFLPSAKEKNDDLAPFWDGYQAEYNTAPHVCLGWATDSFQAGLSRTLMALRKKYPKANLSVKTVMDISPERLATDHPRYVNFGCNPSLSVYDETFPEVQAKDVPFRTAGGHLHFTWNKKTVKQSIKRLDSVLAVICVSLFQYYDEPRRRMFYGRAGEYRETIYGFEYRTLSNAWLIQPGVTNFIYEAARRILNYDMSKYWQVTEEEVRKCVNECDVGLAHEIMRRNINGLRGLLLSMPNAEFNTAKAWEEVIFAGVHTVLRNPDEFSKSWKLEGGWCTHADGPSGNFTTSVRSLVDTKYLD